MHLYEGVYEPTLLRGVILHYCQGIINQLKAIDKSITDSLHSVAHSQEIKTSKTMAYNQEILSIGRNIQ